MNPNRLAPREARELAWWVGFRGEFATTSAGTHTHAHSATDAGLCMEIFRLTAFKLGKASLSLIAVRGKEAKSCRSTWLFGG